MTEPSVMGSDGSWWRFEAGQWVGWATLEEARVETQEHMERYYPEVLQRWDELTKEQR